MHLHRLLPALLITSFIGCQLYAAKIDTIYLQNGDRITVEVQSLNNNQLRVSTDDAGNIRFEWNKLDSVAILNTMRIVLADGRIMYGQLLPSGMENSCTIRRSFGEPVIVWLREVVILSPLEDRFVHRLEGMLSSGMSYTKASRVLQLNATGNIAYRGEKSETSLDYSGIFTREDSSENTQNQSGLLSFQRHLPKKWFLLGQIQAESNSELQLDLRTSALVGGGNSLIMTNRMRLYIAGGLQGGREVSVDLEQFNLEGKVVGDYSVFIYDSPELSFNANGSVIPSLTDPGRVRSEIRSSLKWEVFSDLFLKWSFYYVYDSRPLSGSEEDKSDWGISMLGLEFDF